MAAETDEVLGQGVLRAATKALNLCFAGVMATGSVILQSWALFGVSMAGYATLVVLDLSRLGFWKRVLVEMRTRPPPLPEPDDFADTGARHFANRLQQARCELRRVIQATPTGRSFPPRLVSQLEMIPEVEKRALVLLRRLEEISRYLADKNIRGLRNDVERLNRAAENTSVVRLRTEYRLAHGALREELVALEEIVGSRDLLMAKLETLTGTLEMFPCELVRLRILEDQAREDDGGDRLGDVGFDPRLLLADTDSIDRMLAEPAPKASRG